MYPKRVIIADARLSGLQVLPVDVNSSGGDWKAETPSSGTDRGSAPSPPGTPGGPAADRPVRADPRFSWPRSAGPTASAGMTITGVPRRVAEAAGRVMAVRRPPRVVLDDTGVPAIRCSLREVKGISDAEIDRIVAGQPYVSLRDFWDRARVSRPVAERLVLVGAFDSLYAPAAPPPPNAAFPAAPLSSNAAFSAAPLSSNAASPAPPPLPSPIPAASASPPPPSPNIPDISDMSDERASLRPSRRDLLARVGVLARQSPATRPGRPGSAPPLDLFGTAEAADAMDGLVPAGELRDLDLTERVEAELDILGFDISQHVLHFYADLLAELGVVSSADLAGQLNGEMILVAGAKVATQTPAVRSGQRIIFASLDDAVGLVDLAFFESVQDRCAARLFGSWLLLVRGRVRRAGAGPMAVTVNGTECWDIPALEEIRANKGMAAVRAAMAAGDVGPGAQPGGPDDPASDAATRPVVFANGFTLSPYAETGAPGGSIKRPPRTLWHASPGSAGSPDQ